MLAILVVRDPDDQAVMLAHLDLGHEEQARRFLALIASALACARHLGDYEPCFVHLVLHVDDGELRPDVPVVHDSCGYEAAVIAEMCEPGAYLAQLRRGEVPTVPQALAEKPRVTGRNYDLHVTEGGLIWSFEIVGSDGVTVTRYTTAELTQDLLKQALKGKAWYRVTSFAAQYSLDVDAKTAEEAVNEAYRDPRFELAMQDGSPDNDQVLVTCRLREEEEEEEVSTDVIEAGPGEDQEL